MKTYTGAMEFRKVYYHYDLQSSSLNSWQSTKEATNKHNLSKKNADDLAKTYTINGINLKIEAGKMLAIVGPSGSGKTTFISLIPLLLMPSKGQILFDNHPHNTLSLLDIRSQIALVTQESILLSTTLRENIRYGRINATNEEIEKVIEQAHLEELVRKLPNGMDTQIGERGTILSGGERQRLSLARAILKNPRILLLDEATSQLDSKTERSIQNTVKNMAKNRTTIVVAHRLATIEKADEIVVLEKGKITEQGTHEQLIRKSGTYKQLSALMK